jgi:3-phosphoshikimate 1-carboxyvinyltransferase
MNCIIEASKPGGTVAVPPSKSYTIRALFSSALSHGTSKILNPLCSDDTRATIDVLNSLGASIQDTDDGLLVTGGSLAPSQQPLNCRDSAATLRFAAALCATLPGVSALERGASLALRPIIPLLDVLKKMGADYLCDNNQISMRGRSLRGGLYTIEGDLSSQFISALLLIAPLLKEETAYQLSSMPRSRPYIEMTIETMSNHSVCVDVSQDYSLFKIAPQAYLPASVTIEGDWSSASYLLALGALFGEVTVKGLKLSSLQGDKAIINILENMGASVLIDVDSITVKKSRLIATRFDISQCIDLLPTVAILAATAEGATHLSGIARARLKESNRVEAVCDGLNRIGIRTEEQQDMLIIHGGQPHGGIINSFGDHRIAMAFGILALKTGGTVITGAECVHKTFPSFWDTLKMLGGKISLENE